MLVMWQTLLSSVHECELVVLDRRVCYWPCSWMEGYSDRIAIEWWISFSSSAAGIMWNLKYPEYSRVVYFDKGNRE